MYRFIVLALLAMGLSAPSFAVIETYEFDNPVQEKRYHHFTVELRCPKCQNQNLNDSDSPIAADLRRELHSLLIDGKSDTEITAFMVDRYGDFILYRPRLNNETMVLWFAPGILLLLGGVLIVVIARRARKPKHSDAGTAETPAEHVLTDKQQQQLDKLLGGDKPQ